MTFCCILTILGHSEPLDKAPGGRHSLSFSATLPAFDQLIKNENLLTERVGQEQKSDILVNYGHSGQFWTPELIPLEVLSLFYHSVLLPPHKISVKIMKICQHSELNGSKIEKIPEFGQFQPFLVLWDPLVGPPGVFIFIFHSLLPSPDKISVTVTKTFLLSEMDGSKI